MRADRPEVDLLLFDEPVSVVTYLPHRLHLISEGRRHHWTVVLRTKFLILSTRFLVPLKAKESKQ